MTEWSACRPTAARKRTATWVLLVVSMIMSVVFTYVFPYVTYLRQASSQRTAADLQPLLPRSLVSSVLAGFPFYFGMFALILGVLQFGSEFSWGTFKTTFMQRSDRIRVVALEGHRTRDHALDLHDLGLRRRRRRQPAHRESRSATVNWPPVLDFVKAFAAGWLILTLWGLFGVLLATLSRGIALAMGLGIVYGLVVEGLVTGFGSTIRGAT